MLLGFPGFVLEASWASVWFWLLCLIALVWLRRHRAVSQAARDPVLSPADGGDNPGSLPKLSVLVAAKDEEPNIERCLLGLLGQDYPDFEVIAIDDRSRDRTGEIMDRLAAEDPRLKTIHVRELPEGWAGKNHAMHVGMQQASGEYVCLTDADCRFHSPSLLKAAVSFARREGIEFLSVLPHLEAESFWERVVQPPAGGILVFWFSPERVNDPKSSCAYANGAFMLMARLVYERIGGHERFKGALNEDMHFARQAKREGLSVRVVRGRGLYSVRMYAGFGQIWNGWSRIFYGCFGTWGRLAASAVFLVVFSLLAPLSLLVSPMLGSFGPGIAMAAAVAVVAQQTVLWRFYRLCDLPARWAVTYVLGAGLCLGMICNAMTRLVGVRTRWRGTAYRGGA